MRTVDLEPIDPSRIPEWDRGTRRILLERETDRAWYGRPANNPACAVMEWPRFAWRIASDQRDQLAADLERDQRATGSTRESLHHAHDTEADREERTSGY